MDFDFRNFCRAQAEVQALVAGRNVTAGGGRESRLAVHLDFRAQPIAIAARAAQRDGEPVAGAAVIIAAPAARRRAK